MSKKLTLHELFKTISNQTRIEILISILDNHLTTSDIANRLGYDISTVYRHLTHMKKIGILTSSRKKGIEYFDFASTKIFRILEYAIEFVSEINGTGIIDCSDSTICPFDQNKLNIKPDIILDMRGEICPIPDIKTRKVLENMDKDKILLVIVDYPLSAERIPISVTKEGNTVLGKISEFPGEIKIYIKKS
ncbi:disulfide bond formation regulator [Marinitoga sp. 1135]|uniref:Putative redox protein, regulator of disulfide bond formation n=1 Tax=Marinitoga piezophila (strain DSM 14283 / JCM 11233 / KA3) TaxID=443254 RepID=H2J2P1_MARPK|nr:MULTISPECIES: sulfurtransferase TusA family protein [Marinitoga]AEX84485.1 putative redox protein, regulator of disulfide bond formation [Marinitoga piezophila KA3]APT74983.1 disulfide bond formation regulator [Marinitoga sp. 1137]NUU94739.1 disulfide bond formation regulator [Marinitoga sp. 1135]NUU96668.1 disulfide bond formation regulator [Marinitoga sp. 1138]